MVSNGGGVIVIAPQETVAGRVISGRHLIGWLAMWIKSMWI
jgi:hypothetical protein